MLYLASSVRERGFPTPFCNVLQKTAAETRAAPPLLLPVPPAPSRTPLKRTETHEQHFWLRQPWAVRSSISCCPWARAYDLLKTNWGGSSPSTAFLFRLRVFDMLHPLCLPKPDSSVDLPRSFEVCARCRMGDFIKTETSGIPLLLVLSEFHTSKFLLKKSE